MNRRKLLKLLGSSVKAIAGLIFASWKWQILDQLTYKCYLPFKRSRQSVQLLIPLFPKFFHQSFQIQVQTLLKCRTVELLKCGIVEMSNWISFKI